MTATKQPVMRLHKRSDKGETAMATKPRKTTATPAGKKPKAQGSAANIAPALGKEATGTPQPEISLNTAAAARKASAATTRATPKGTAKRTAAPKPRTTRKIAASAKATARKPVAKPKSPAPKPPARAAQGKTASIVKRGGIAAGLAGIIGAIVALFTLRGSTREDNHLES